MLLCKYPEGLFFFPAPTVPRFSGQPPRNPCPCSIDDIIGSELPTTYQATGLTVWIESEVDTLTMWNTYVRGSGVSQLSASSPVKNNRGT